MARTHIRKETAAGTDIVAVEMAPTSDTNWYAAAEIRVAEIEKGTDYVRKDGKNVIREIDSFGFNARGSRAPGTNYDACLSAAARAVDRAVDDRAHEKDDDYEI